MKYNKYSILFIVLLVSMISCTAQKEDQPGETILVKIGDKTISVNEFIRRAEYTIRPPYCKSGLPLQKKIVLNSLIAEKMMALEAGSENEFINHPKVQNYLRGRKEQSMRQWQYYKEATEKARIDSALIRNYLEHIGKTYKIKYINIPDSTLASYLTLDFRHSDETFEKVLAEDYGLSKIPEREVSWNPSENDLIMDSLYTRELNKEQVIGPIHTREDEYLFIKIDGWTERVIMTENQAVQRWSDIEEWVVSREAAQIYSEYIGKVMKGKRLDFDPEVFGEVVNLIGPMYLKVQDEQEKLMKEGLWGQSDKPEDDEDIRIQLDALKGAPFFKIDGNTWSVGDFLEYLAVHPLVFRKKKMKTEEFGAYFRLAVVDMIRDKYLTEEAYKAGYDQVNIVKREVGMWEDYLNAEFQKSAYLSNWHADSLYQENYISVIQNNLNPLVDSLQAKYSDKIEINVTAFNEIKLTGIDMVATGQNVPFPIAVPAFPRNTTDNRLDYGAKMKE